MTMTTTKTTRWEVQLRNPFGATPLDVFVTHGVVGSRHKRARDFAESIREAFPWLITSVRKRQ